MASPHSTFTELVATTLRKHKKETVDNVSNHNALLSRIMKKKRTLDGGTSIVTPLEYAENSTYIRFSGYDTLNTSASDVLSAAEFQWRQIALAVVANGTELRANSGSSQLVDLVKSRIKNAIKTFKNNFSVDVYSDGTLPNQINGLQALVADAGTGTIGGIDSSTWAFWQNKVQSAAAPIQGGGAITVSSTTIENDLMLPLWMELTRGDDKPDLIIASNDYFQLYEKSQIAFKQYTSSNSAQGGFISLKYKTADVIFDGGSGIPNAHMYFLNTDYINLVVHSQANLEVMDDRVPYNQDAAVIPIIWQGNLEVTNRGLQGVLKA